MQNLYKEYQKLETQYKILVDLRETMREKIVLEMTKEGTDKAETDYGRFTVGTRSSWEYTDAVKKLEERVKIAKIKEQQKGVATQSMTNYLVYSEVKPE